MKTATRTVSVWQFSPDGRTRIADKLVTETYRPVQFSGQPAVHIGQTGQGWSGAVLCGTSRRRYPVAADGQVTCAKCQAKNPELAAELNAR